MMIEQLATFSASELLAYIAKRQVSPIEIVELFYRRIEAVNPKLNAYLSLNYDSAIDAAKVAESDLNAQHQIGPLHGLPIAFKDTQNTGGIRTTMGSLVFHDNVPERDAAIVEKLKAAGAIILGKTNVPEFGIVGTCENRLGGPGRNPWNVDRTPGGSSGGAAAAVAAYLCPVATGSDGGGSIRIPSNFCGVYGIKPTQGRVSAYTGATRSSTPNMFSQNGPITRTVRDAATILQVMAGYDSRDPTTLRESSPDFVSALDRDISGLRVAWSPDFGFANVWPEVRDVTLGAARQFEDLGCHIDEANLTMEEPYDVFGPIQAAHAYSSMGHYLNTHQDQLTDFAKFYLEFGSRVTASDYAESLVRIEILKALITDLFDEYDLLLSPTSCFPAFPNEEFPGRIKGSSTFPEQYWNGAFTLPINVIGHPAATVPAGFSSDGLPIGLHIVGKWGDEATVLAASAAFERVRPWIHKTPFI